MATRVASNGSSTYRVATSHLITTCATFAALILFVYLGAQVLPGAVGSAIRAPSTNALVAAFLLNIAIVLFGWRRAAELSQALSALKQAEDEAHVIALTDHSTGLPNRRALMAQLDGKFEQARSGGV